jgi:hypothetical protein
VRYLAVWLKNVENTAFSGGFSRRLKNILWNRKSFQTKKMLDPEGFFCYKVWLSGE